MATRDLRHDRFHDGWEESEIFGRPRDIEQLKGKSGFCEFNKLCLGCRARAFGMTGNFMAEEPFCVYQPQRQTRRKRWSRFIHPL